MKIVDLVESQKLSQAREEVQDRRCREVSMEEREEKEYPMKSNGKCSWSLKAWEQDRNEKILFFQDLHFQR